MSCYRCFWKERYYWCLLTSRLQLTNLYSDFVFQSSHVKSHLNVITTVSLKALGNKACHQQHYQYQEQTTLGARLRLMGRVTVRTKYNTGTWRQLEWAVTNKRLQAQQTSRSLLIRTGDKYREGTGQQPGYVRVRIIQIYLASGSHWSWRLVRRSVLPTMALDMPPDMHCLKKTRNHSPCHRVLHFLCLISGIFFSQAHPYSLQLYSWARSKLGFTACHGILLNIKSSQCSISKPQLDVLRDRLPSCLATSSCLRTVFWTSPCLPALSLLYSRPSMSN